VASKIYNRFSYEIYGHHGKQPYISLGGGGGDDDDDDDKDNNKKTEATTTTTTMMTNTTTKWNCVYQCYFLHVNTD
jgi:hypothetical protein